jgi:hypothetical protein
VRYDATAHVGLIPPLELQFSHLVEELFQACACHVHFLKIAVGQPTSVEATVILTKHSFEFKARYLMKRNLNGRTHDLFEA